MKAAASHPYCTHHGLYPGDMMGIPPTNREVACDYGHIVPFRDAKGVEHRGVRDDMTLMPQLGVALERPEPGQPASDPRQ